MQAGRREGGAYLAVGDPVVGARSRPTEAEAGRIDERLSTVPTIYQLLFFTLSLWNNMSKYIFLVCKIVLL